MVNDRSGKEIRRREGYYHDEWQNYQRKLEEGKSTAQKKCSERKMETTFRENNRIVEEQ